MWDVRRVAFNPFETPMCLTLHLFRMVSPTQYKKKTRCFFKICFFQHVFPTTCFQPTFFFNILYCKQVVGWKHVGCKCSFPHFSRPSFSPPPSSCRCGASLPRQGRQRSLRERRQRCRCQPMRWKDEDAMVAPLPFMSCMVFCGHIFVFWFSRFFCFLVWPSFFFCCFSGVLFHFRFRRLLDLTKSMCYRIFVGEASSLANFTVCPLSSLAICPQHEAHPTRSCNRKRQFFCPLRFRSWFRRFQWFVIRPQWFWFPCFRFGVHGFHGVFPVSMFSLAFI